MSGEAEPRSLSTSAQSIVHGAEGATNVFAQRSDDRDCTNKNQREHNRVLNRGGAILAGQETHNRGMNVGHDS